MYDEGTELSPELIELMQKVGGQEYSRLAFEQLVGPPEIDVVALTLMQKTASVTDLELFKAAERACPGDPIQLYEELGGQYKRATPDEAQQHFDAAEAGLNEKKAASVVGRAKGVTRVGELLSGSRAAGLSKARDELAEKHHLPRNFFNYDKATAPAAQRAATRSDRLGKVLSAEESKVRATRGAAGAAVGVAAAGVAAAHHKDSDK